MRVCGKCNEAKALEDFYPSRRDRCKDCHLTATRAWKRAQPKLQKQQNRRWRLLTRYGLTPTSYDYLLEAQGGACPICGATESVVNKHFAQLVVDHDHATEQVRGLLCDHCNHGLGKFKDNPEFLRRAAEYLENPPAPPLIAEMPGHFLTNRGAMAASLFPGGFMETEEGQP